LQRNERIAGISLTIAAKARLVLIAAHRDPAGHCFDPARNHQDLEPKMPVGIHDELEIS
jgi:hypothetical protein